LSKMVCEPDLDSLDEDTLKPIQFKLDGDKEWREMREMEVLEAYREARIPSSTLFRRGDDGVTRTLGTLVSWNGRECPFAAFSEPVKREGRREKRNSESVFDSSVDENQNSMNRSTGMKDGSEGNESEEHISLFTRIIAYIDQIQQRMESIEKTHVEQQSQLAGAEVFMKKVASLEVRLHACETSLKMIDKRSHEMHEFVFFSKRASLGHSGKPSTMQPAELDEMFEATKKMNADVMQRSQDLDEYKEDVQKVHNMELEVNKRLEVLDDRYSQLVTMLSAHERNEDVREALEEWNKKEEEKRMKQEKEQSQHQRQTGFGKSNALVPMPKKSTAIGAVSNGEKLDWRVMQEGARVEQQVKQQSSMRSQLTTPMGLRIQALLLGREVTSYRNDREASQESKNRLHQLGTDSDIKIASKLSEFMECPNFTCICGAQLQSGISVIVHFNSKNHSRCRPKPVYQTDIDYWTDVIVCFKTTGRAPVRM
ncbi:hypothetical protein PMAYCL1PPCAC_07500, partial [Pristionchus mayeri]